MVAATTDALADYIRDLADRMLLRDWVFFVSDDPEDCPDDGIDDERCATFRGTLGRRAGAVWINREWWASATPEERRQTAIHELIHAHEHASREIVIHAVTVYPRRTADVLQAIYDVQMEYAIDALADVIAPFMPLPPEPELYNPEANAAIAAIDGGVR